MKNESTCVKALRLLSPILIFPLRVLYLTGVAVMSLAFVFAFNRLMMWC